MNETFIVAAKRTPIGGFMGALKSYTATQLGTIAIAAIANPEILQAVDAVYMGNVLSAGLGQLPARQAALHAGLKPAADCTTVNKVCSSGLKAVTLGVQGLQLGMERLVVAGGMESMTNTPHYLFRRTVFKMGDDVMSDGLLKDGLTDAFHGFHMGMAAERCAREYGITREEQDAYALASYERAAAAAKAGKLADEIITIRSDGATVLDNDEDVAKIIPDKLPQLKPVFDTEGTITAANASNLNDGAAAVLLASREAIAAYDLHPLARIVAFADAADTPERFGTAPSLAVAKALQKSRLSIRDMDFVELNEAYAAVALANLRLLRLNHNRMNVYGGAVAMGHPLGASGARILCTLLSVLRQEGGRYGLAAICNGGGGATALIIENIGG